MKTYPCPFCGKPSLIPGYCVKHGNYAGADQRRQGNVIAMVPSLAKKRKKARS